MNTYVGIVYDDRARICRVCYVNSICRKYADEYLRSHLKYIPGQLIMRKINTNSNKVVDITFI